MLLKCINYQKVLTDWLLVDLLRYLNSDPNRH